MEKIDVDAKNYFGSYICNKTLVNVYMDDYGQQYYFQFVDSNGELQERCCGAYQFDFETQIEYELDYDSWFNKRPEWFKKMHKEGQRRAANKLQKNDSPD